MTIKVEAAAGKRPCDLDLKPGDVVRCVGVGGGGRTGFTFHVGREYRAYEWGGKVALFGVSRSLNSHDFDWLFEVVSRAPEAAQ